MNTYGYHTCTFAYLRYLEKIKDAVSHLRLGNNFPLNCSLAPPHVQRRPHQRQIISNLYPTSKHKSKLVVWEYFVYRKDERLFVLKDRHSSQNQPQKEETSNMFTYISEQHPSVQIQLCPIYNLRLKSYDFRDAK